MLQDVDRQAVTQAVRSSPNLREAAHALGASRRTLQNRMREYGMPQGRSGRPKRPLEYRPRAASSAGLTEALLAGAGIVGLYLLLRKRAPTVAGALTASDARNRYLQGTLALCA